MYKITDFFVLYHSLLYPLVLFTQSNFSVMGPFYSVDVSNLIARSKPDCVYTAICVVFRISRIVPLVSQINHEVHSFLMWSDYSSKPGGKTEIFTRSLLLKRNINRRIQELFCCVERD